MNFPEKALTQINQPRGKIKPSFGVPIALMERAFRSTGGFSNWPDRCLLTLISSSILERIPDDAVISNEKLALPETLVVVSGQLIVEYFDSKNSGVGAMAVGAGFVVGLSFVMSADCIPHFRLRALRDAVVIRCPSTALMSLLDDEPSLWKEMGPMYVRQYREMLSTLLVQTTGSTLKRVAATLGHLAKIDMPRDKIHLKSRIQLSQEDLARILNFSRPTINKTLSSLEAMQLIRVEYKRIEILNPTGLARVAEASH